MERLKIEFPSFGWRQILTARSKILDSFDRARNHARGHEIETYHGKAAEAACREWLKDFLPKRYAVTAGYVVSPGFSSAHRAPHFDVIIYDHLESPVLWVEENADTSKEGRSLAVPVEYVRAVIEVKSQLSAKTMREAVTHLGDLQPVLRGVDVPNERYKLYLPASFCCGVIFVDLKEKHANSRKVLTAATDGASLRGFFGGLVLRGEGHTLPHTGRLLLTQHEAASTSGSRSSLLEFGLSKTVQVAERAHVGAMLTWAEHGFAQFAFDLIAMIDGTYEVGYLSSFYGMGSSWHELVCETGMKVVEHGPQDTE